VSELLFLNLDAFLLLAGATRAGGAGGMRDGFRFGTGRNDPQTASGAAVLDAGKSRCSRFHDFLPPARSIALLFLG